MEIKSFSLSMEDMIVKKSFSVNLTRQEWLGILYMLNVEIDGIQRYIDAQDQLNWIDSVANERQCTYDYLLRMLSARKKIDKKLDENS